MKNIVVIIGPTGVGKTDLSVSLAKKINAEIINADSMQFYKDLNIGTAKIKEEEKNGIEHHLFDIVSPKEMYTIYDYQKDARKKIEDIIKSGKNVVMVGGSGLYIRAVLYDYKLEKENIKLNFDNLSNEELYKKVLKEDSNITIHPNNRKRLIRFFEKSKLGKSTVPKAEKIYDFDIIGLTTERSILYDKINKRVDKMLEEGLLEEVETLYNKGISSKAINTGIGYKELYKYFNKEISLIEAVEMIKKNSRHYAKRQYTFFNHQFDVKWFNTNYEDFNKTIEEVYKYLKRD